MWLETRITCGGPYGMTPPVARAAVRTTRARGSFHSAARESYRACRASCPAPSSAGDGGSSRKRSSCLRHVETALIRTPPLSHAPDRAAVRGERLHQHEGHGDGAQRRREELEERDGPAVEAPRKAPLQGPDRRERRPAWPRRARPERKPGQAEPENACDEVGVRDRDGRRSLEPRRQIQAQRCDRNRAEARDDGRGHAGRQFLSEPAVERAAHDALEKEGAENRDRREPQEAPRIHVAREGKVMQGSGSGKVCETYESERRGRRRRESRPDSLLHERRVTGT